MDSPVAYLQRVIDGLCELSLKDPLTGLSNRRHFRTVLDRTIDMVARSGDPALLLMLDIDHFKSVNDRFGHDAGDELLRQASQRLLRDGLAQWMAGVVNPKGMPSYQDWRQGVVDGQENPLEFIDNFKFNEVQKHLTLTRTSTTRKRW